MNTSVSPFHGLSALVPGLVALVALLGAAGSAEARRPIGPIVPGPVLGDIELVCGGARCQEVVAHGQRWVVGSMGERYGLALVNRSDLWLEAVVTVDGRSILDGERRSSRSRGYLIPPRDRVVVDGWRVNRDSVAAFRFTSVGDSYAARMGDASEVGVIRVDFYPERASTWVPRRDPWLERSGRTEPGRAIDDGSDGDGGAGAARPAPKAAESGVARHFDRDRQGLGTEFGERRHQPISERDFERASSSPARTLVIRYDDRAGLVARGVLPERRPWRDPWDGRRDDGPWVQPPPGWQD